MLWLDNNLSLAAFMYATAKKEGKPMSRNLVFDYASIAKHQRELGGQKWIKSEETARCQKACNCFECLKKRLLGVQIIIPIVR